jgi:PKD repeat protein
MGENQRTTPYLQKWPFLGALFLFLISFAPAAKAQCDRIGKVSSVIPDCGAVVVDINSGESLMAVEGAADLSGSQYLMFSAEPSFVPTDCPANGYQKVALTCISQDFPCVGTFAFVADENDPMTITFTSMNPDIPGVEYFWDFGDGTEGTGHQVVKHFAQESQITVCLKVNSANGCSANHCEMVGVGQTLSCGFHAEVTAIGTQLYGKLIADSDNTMTLNHVQWYSSKSTQILSDSPSFDTPVPFYGDYAVCAFYESLNPADGTVCTSTTCVNLTVAETAHCFIPAMNQPTVICPPTNAPVCGCNAIKYDNECTAMNAGITAWWAGNCDQNNLLDCHAEMEVEVLSYSPDNGYLVQFTNMASGVYADVQLDFGDGTPFFTNNQWDVVTHYYANGGIYRTNLTVWKNQIAVSSYTKLLVTDAYNMSIENLPNPTDYVMPGDANGDHKANMHDLLPIGVGYYTDGVPRPNASDTWAPQFAPNWEDHYNAINYKHVDCNGNGSVDDFDASVILENYAALDTLQAPVLNSAPKVWISFPKDTIVINPNNPVELEIEANLHIGSASQPALGLYGASMALKYPEYTSHNPDFYYSSDFFGAPIQVLPLTKDIYNRRQFDLGLVRKNGVPVSGYGTMAKMVFRSDFVIVIDIIDRAESKYIPFMVPVRNLRGVDENGLPKYLSEPAQLDTVWLKLEESVTSVGNQALDQKIQVYPNPASEEAAVYTGDLQVQTIEIFNMLGQKIQQVIPSGNLQTRFPVQGMGPGVYTVRITTDQGIAEKRLSVQ